MNSTFAFLDLIALGCGIYCLYTWIKLAVGKKLFQNGLLVPKEKTVKDCLDEQAYIAYIMPPLATTAIVTTLYGAFCLLNDMSETPILPLPWSLIPLVAVLGCLAWYAVRNSKANRAYFGM